MGETDMAELKQAPKLQISQWLNSDKDLSLDDFKGKVVVIEAFQMLCPSCGSHGLPQAMKIRKIFSPDDVVVIGIHTVFEHHDEQGTEPLKTFLKDKDVTFPVGIDAFGEDKRLPLTMKAYGLRGTPSQIILDRDGMVRKVHFGIADDMITGAEIVSLLYQPTKAQIEAQAAKS